MKDESEENLALDLSLVSVHMLTCPQRAASCAATLARWDATDWGRLCGRPRIHLDDAPETSEAVWGDAQRGERIVAAFAKMLVDAVRREEEFTAEAQSAQRGHSLDSSLRPLRLGGDPWILFLEDDLDFHPRIGAAVASWEGLKGYGMRTLFNPGLSVLKLRHDAPGADEDARVSRRLVNGAIRVLRRMGRLDGPRQFCAEPTTFLGAQALLLRRSFAQAALDRWPRLNGMQSQRLATLLADLYPSLPILVHRPSLVQHLPVEGGSGWGARVQQALDFDPSWTA